MSITVPCAGCGKPVTVKPYKLLIQHSVSCSKECAYMARQGRPVLARQRRAELTCDFCGNKFIETEAHARDRRFCSIACKAEYQKTALRGKNNTYYGRKHSDETRSLISANHARWYGKDNPNWQGGVTDLKTLLRKSKKYKQWQMEVFRRDHFRSVLSGKSAQKWFLVTHHIRPFTGLLREFLSIHSELDPANESDKAKLVELAMDYLPLWDVGNGMTMLREEHTSLHQNRENREENYD